MGHMAGRVCLLQTLSILSIYDCKSVKEIKKKNLLDLDYVAELGAISAL